MNIFRGMNRILKIWTQSSLVIAKFGSPIWWSGIMLEPTRGNRSTKRTLWSTTTDLWPGKRLPNRSPFVDSTWPNIRMTNKPVTLSSEPGCIRCEKSTSRPEVSSFLISIFFSIRCIDVDQWFATFAHKKTQWSVPTIKTPNGKCPFWKQTFEREIDIRRSKFVLCWSVVTMHSSTLFNFRTWFPSCLPSVRFSALRALDCASCSPSHRS